MRYYIGHFCYLVLCSFLCIIFRYLAKIQIHESKVDNNDTDNEKASLNATMLEVDDNLRGSIK